MKIILRKNIDSLGKIGDVVDVAEGYARNYLVPRNFAMKESAASRKAVEIEKNRLRAEFAKGKEVAVLLSEKLEAMSCTIAVKVGENDKLFGSVTSQDVAKQLKGEGIDISKKQIVMEDKHIKELGVYKMPVKLGWDVTAILKVWVVKA